MINTAECPNVELDPAEQAELFIRTALQAGSLMTERCADLYLNVGVRDGMLDQQDPESHVIVHGMAADRSNSLLLHGNVYTGDTSCKLVSRTRGATAVGEERLSWLEQGEARSLNRVTASVDANKLQSIIDREPATLTTVGDMLQRVRDEADPLPGDGLTSTLRGARGGPDLMLVPSTELVPIVAGLTQAIGTALLRPRGEGQLVDARLKYNVGSSGRIYGDFSWRNRRNEVYLSVADREARKRIEFGLEFWFGLIHDDTEASFVRCSLKTTGPEIGTTMETLGTHGEALRVTPNKDFQASYEPQTNGIADLGGQALALLGANPAPLPRHQ